MRSTTYHLTSQDWWKEKPQSSQPPVYHSPILTPLLNTGDLGSKIMHRTVTKHPANNTQSKETGTRRKWWPRLKALATNRSKSLQSFTAFQIQTEQKWEKKEKKSTHFLLTGPEMKLFANPDSNIPSQQLPGWLLCPGLLSIPWQWLPPSTERWQLMRRAVRM